MTENEMINFQEVRDEATRLAEEFFTHELDKPPSAQVIGQMRAALLRMFFYVAERDFAESINGTEKDFQISKETWSHILNNKSTITWDSNEWKDVHGPQYDKLINFWKSQRDSQ